MNMNIMHLKYAVEIAKTGSVKKAANALFMGQPNLSRAIKELETSLGIEIFERSAKGMTVTPDGEEFLRYARKILQQIDDVEQYYHKGKQMKQKFSVCVPRASYISDAFSRFSNTIKDGPAEILYGETNTMYAIDHILQHKYGLGIIRYASVYDQYFKQILESKGLSYEMITQFCYVLLMHRDSPLAQLKTVNFSDLQGFIEIAHADPYVSTLSSSEFQKEDLPDPAARRILVFERASQLNLLSENLNTFMWVSPMPGITMERYGLVQRKCPENRQVYKDVLIYRKGYRLSELDNLFLDELFRSKRECMGYGG